MGDDAAKGQNSHDAWLTNPVIGVPASIFANLVPAGAGPAPEPPAKPDDPPPADSGTQRTGDNAAQPKPELADTAKDLLTYYASEFLKPFKEQALSELKQVWERAPGGVIAAGTVLGAAGVAYLVKTGGALPSLPAIPLDFLAGRQPAFKGAELNVELSGTITSPSGIKVSITFHEQAPEHKEPPHTGRGHVLPTRLALRQDSAKAAKPESGAEVEIEGEVPIPSKALSDDVAATRSAILDGKVEVEFGGTPAWVVRVVSVTDNYHPDQFGLNAPPQNRALTVRLRTSLPPMFWQKPDALDEASVRVRINGTSNDGEAKVRVHYRTFPAPN